MDKMRMKSVDITAQNIEKIGEMFPNCITETVDENGKPKKAINFELLRQMLSSEVLEGDEAYEFTWVGKKAAIVEANEPIRKTLRPVIKDEITPTGKDNKKTPYCSSGSKNFDTTENLYIEGDNLDVLKLLQESYLNKVKMIYIDPPYNTGKDFIYKDNFHKSSDEYDEESGMYDDEGNRQFVQNNDSNPRFHSDWCSRIYSCLTLARNLLTQDGVIFISIDDNEVDNLRKICNEIFGESNFVAQCVRKRRDSQANLSKNISPIHEYVSIYAKSKGAILNKVVANIKENDFKNPDNDARGPYVTMPCTNKGGAVFMVTTPSGTEIIEEWRFKKETYDRLISENKIVFPKGGEGKPRYKLFLKEKLEHGVLANTWLDNIASNQEATREIKEMFNALLFDTPKPVGLIKFCNQLATDKDSIILDFFAGSSTTAHAVMQLNAEDGGNRKFIMVQLPEVCVEDSEAYKAGYKNICEIGKERIRRAGEKIKAEIETANQQLKLDEKEKKVPDIGFRVLKIDESNMTDVYYSADEYKQEMLNLLESNVKADRSDSDLLFSCLLEWGLPLSESYYNEMIENCTVHTYGTTMEETKSIIDEIKSSDSSTDKIPLIACFDENIPESVVKVIAKRQPIRAVFRDRSFANSPDKINVTEIFKLLSPDTRVKVL